MDGEHGLLSGLTSGVDRGGRLFEGALREGGDGDGDGWEGGDNSLLFFF